MWNRSGDGMLRDGPRTMVTPTQRNAGTTCDVLTTPTHAA
jgi:hypothetical protein